MMLRLCSFFVSLLISVFCALSTDARTDNEVRTEQLLIQSVGGERAAQLLRECSGLSMSGELKMGSSSGAFDFCYRAPDSFYLRLSLGPLTVERWYDGTRGWQRSAGGVITTFSGRELDHFLQESRVQAGTFVRADSRLKTTLAGESSFRKTPVTDLVITSSSDTTRLLLDAASGLPVAKMGRLDNSATEEIIDSLAWRDSILVPIISTTTMQGIDITSRSTIISFQRNQSCDVWRDILLTMTPSVSPVVTATAISFKLIDGHIYLPVTLKGGKKGYMILDSGASANFLFRSVVDELGLTITGEIPSRGVAGFETVGILSLDSLFVGDILQPTLPFGVTSLQMLEGIRIGSIPCVGILGYEFLARQVISVDYEKNQIMLNRPLTDLSPLAEEIPFTLFLNLPIVKGSLNNESGSFLVDLGNAGGLIVHEPFARSHSLFDPNGEQHSGFGGVGGSVSGWPIRLKSFSLITRDGESEGQMTVDSVEAVVTSGSYGLTGSVDIDGNIGSRFLQDYRVTFDYANSRLFLERRP